MPRDPYRAPYNIGHGEWWINEDGQPTFADGDISDVNHMCEAFDSMMAMHDVDLHDPDIPEILPAEPLSEAAARYLRDEVEIPKELMEFLVQQGDPRDWAMEKMGWTRAAGLRFQMWTMTTTNLRNLASGLWDAWDMDEEAVEFLMATKERGSIEVMSTHKVYQFPLWVLFDEKVTPAMIREASDGARQFNPIHPFEKWTSKGKVIYHVTLSENVPRIKKEGLRRFQPSHWAERGTGERYGEGQIFAFEDKTDAMYWAAKMEQAVRDPSDYRPLGSDGLISIVSIKTKKGEVWDIDISDPLSQDSGKGGGCWLRNDYPVPASRIGAVKVVKVPDIQKWMKAEHKPRRCAHIDWAWLMEK